VMAPRAHAQQPSSITLDQVIDKIVGQEQAEVKMLRDYSPLVETYIQKLRPDQDSSLVPDGDVYFIGRAQLKDRVDLVPLTDDNSGKSRKEKGKPAAVSTGFSPQDFLQMIEIDQTGFDRQHYSFDFVRREFLGEVRCLVFDVTPQAKAGKGKFAGRVWVEDQDYHVVRFNGGFAGSSKSGQTFHFDSWRVNAGENEWLPALIYTEADDDRNAIAKRLVFKGQTRLWGYNLGRTKQTQEMGKILVEADVPVQDKADALKDVSPLEAQRTWNSQAEENVLDRMERLGLLAPRGEVDQVLETVVNNLEVTNNLNIDPEIRARVLMTSTLEAFTIGHTIVMSRGLIDVLPDEASLAAMLARELSHVVLGHRIDTQYSFFDQLLFDEKDTFRHWGFARTPEEQKAAMDKALELLKKSPYKDQLQVAQKFLAALESRSKEIPNLISPHLGDEVPTGWEMVSAAPAASVKTASANPADQIVALPLGGRIKLDPWNNRLTMLRAKPVGAVAEREKMPFEVTPFILYLTRENAATAEKAVPAEKVAARKAP
jgi:Peptidase family M48